LKIFQLLLLLLTGLCSTAGPAVAQQVGLVHELKIGVLAHDVPELWSGFRLERGGVDLNAELQLRPALAIFGGHLRPVIGLSVHTGSGTSRGYIDARWQVETASGIFFGLGLGAAIHNGHINPDALDRKALGSRVLFHIPFEVGYRVDAHSSLSVYFEHMSNASLAKWNEGFDAVGLRYGYRF
jgi:lipid A 3-O-deacylase